MMATIREEIKAAMGELGQQLSTRLFRLEQPHRKGPVRNQNSNREDEDGDNETMPSLEEDDPHINHILGNMIPLKTNKAEMYNSENKIKILNLFHLTLHASQSGSIHGMGDTSRVHC